MPSYNNNNNGRANNHYIVLVPTVAPSSSRPAPAGNHQQLAHAVVAEAAKCEKDRIMAALICRAASQPSFLCAASGSKSSRANNGSHSSGPSVHPTSHIHHGMIAPLPTSDRMRRSNTTSLMLNHWVKADPKEVADSDLL